MTRFSGIRCEVKAVESDDFPVGYAWPLGDRRLTYGHTPNRSQFGIRNIHIPNKTIFRLENIKNWNEMNRRSSERPADQPTSEQVNS